MYIDYTPEQHKLHRELRAYISELVTEDVLAEVMGTEGGPTGPRTGNGFG